MQMNSPTTHWSQHSELLRRPRCIMHQDAQLYDMSNSHRRDRPTREFATRKITAKYKARYRQEYIYNITK